MNGFLEMIYSWPPCLWVPHPWLQPWVENIWEIIASVLGAFLPSSIIIP
jgi:hypothetical protein